MSLNNNLKNRFRKDDFLDLYENDPHPKFVLDSIGRFLFLNKKARQMMHIKKGDIPLGNISILFEHKENGKRMVKQVMQGKSVEHENRISKKNMDNAQLAMSAKRLPVSPAKSPR